MESLETRLIHAGEPRPPHQGAVSLPIYQSSTFASENAASYDDVRYIRLNNTPNHLALGAKLASIEGAESGAVTSSGMSAITTTLLALTEPGDHVLAQDGLYGGTHHFLAHDLPRLGREVSFFQGNDPGLAARPNTRVLYVEAMSNPLLRVLPLPELAAWARQRGILSIIDNTFPSPVNFNPIAHGYDVVLHSATKYLNGHTDIVAGAVLGRRETVRSVVSLLNHLGGCLDPHACFLLQRGMKTLALRVRWQNEAALKLARALAGHPRVRAVHHPGLPSHPDHARARELFRGLGGMLSFEIDGTPAEADAVLSRLRLPISAPSLGGVESLVTRPATTSHLGVPREERIRQGISDTLIRVSVGIEDPDDLIADFRQALGKHL